MKNLTMIALLGAASVMLAGCGEDKKEEPAASTPAAVEAPATPTATETPAAVQEATPAVVEESAAPVEETAPAAVEETAAPAEEPAPAASTEMTPSVSTTDEAETTPQQ